MRALGVIVEVSSGHKTDGSMHLSSTALTVSAVLGIQAHVLFGTTASSRKKKVCS